MNPRYGRRYVRLSIAAIAISWLLWGSRLRLPPALTGGSRDVVVEPDDDYRGCTIGQGMGLLRPLPELKFEGVAFKDVVDFVTDVTANGALDVNWAAIERAGISREQPISMNVRNVSIRKFVDKMVATADPGGQRIAVDVSEEKNRVFIDSRENILSGNYSRTYYVSDLFDIAKPGAADVFSKRLKARTGVFETVGNGSDGILKPAGSHVFVRHRTEGHDAVIATLAELRWERDASYFAVRTCCFLGIVIMLGALVDICRRRRHYPGNCLSCGYDLRSSVRRCPECGKAFVRSEVARHRDVQSIE